METDLETHTYDIILDTAKAVQPAELLRMLETVEKLVKRLEETETYQRIYRTFNTYRPGFEEQVRDLKLTCANPNLMFWVTGLRMALDYQCFTILHFQLSLFIIGQKENFYRIDDDKTRLITTYFYFKLVNRMAHTLEP